GDALSRWMARAAPVARVYSVLRLVLRQVIGIALRFYLGSRHAAPHPGRSDDEFCLEIHASDGVHLRCCGGGLALCRPSPVGMAVVIRGHRRRLLRIVDLS